jgi:hypothetical protein
MNLEMRSYGAQTQQPVLPNKKGTTGDYNWGNKKLQRNNEPTRDIIGLYSICSSRNYLLLTVDRGFWGFNCAKK